MATATIAPPLPVNLFPLFPFSSVLSVSSANKTSKIAE